MKLNFAFMLLFFLAFVLGCKKNTPLEPFPQNLLRKVTGTNCFTWTPLAKLDTFEHVRVYISGQFIFTNRGLFVEPIFQSRTDDGKGLDTWLAECKKRGIEPILCINQTPLWYRNSTLADTPIDYTRAATKSSAGNVRAAFWDELDHPPIKAGKDRTDPKSYADYAGLLGQLAKRYGTKAHPISALRVDTRSRWTNDPPNVPKTALGLVKYIEVWNEPDKWWKRGDGSGIYMEPEEYAAMLHACRDSILAADPNMVVVMGGLTGFDLAYLQRMDDWFVKQGGSWPPNLVVNVHHYSNTGNQPNKWPPTWNLSGGCGPDDDKAISDVFKVVQFAKNRRVQCWVSEFGYDTRPPSWAHVAPQGGKTSEEMQGHLIAETIRFYQAAGVDRVHVFNANDEQGAPNGGLYQNSGLLYGEGEQGRVWQPKPAYDTICQLIKKRELPF